MICVKIKSALCSFLDRSDNAGKPRNVIKKQNGNQCCSSNRQSMKFMGVTTG